MYFTVNFQLRTAGRRAEVVGVGGAVQPYSGHGRIYRVASYQIPLTGIVLRRMTGYVKDKQQIEKRLSRIEGQVRGLCKMVEEDRYCIDVLTQVSAVQSALESVALLLLRDHTQHCVTEAIRAGDGSAKVRELSEAVERLVRR